MEAFEVILGILNNLIVNKAFNKKISLKRWLPYIFIYYSVIILLLFVIIFLSISYIRLKNIIGYFLILLGIILLYYYYYHYLLIEINNFFLITVIHRNWEEERIFGFYMKNKTKAKML